MSVLAGYDMVVELSKAALLPQLYMVSVSLPGNSSPVPLTPPFELRLSETVEGIGAVRLHLVVTAIDLGFLEFGPDGQIRSDGRIRSDGIAKATIILRFRDASITGLGDRPLTGLNGTVRVSAVPLQIVRRTWREFWVDSPVVINAEPGVDPWSDVLDVLLRENEADPGARASVEALQMKMDFAAPGVTAFVVLDESISVLGVLTDRFPLPASVPARIGPQYFPLQFGRSSRGLLRAPGMPITTPSGGRLPGQLPGFPWFKEVEIHALDQNTVGIFGLLMDERQGNYAKPNTAISAGHNTCISVSGRVFHNLIFCPAMRDRLELHFTTDLPRFCGSAVSGWFGRGPVGVEFEDMVITELNSRFVEGNILISGRAEKAVPCADVHGRFTVPLQLLARGTTLRAQAGPPDVRVDVTGEVLCWLGGPFTSWWNTAVHFVALNAAREGIGAALRALPTTTLPGSGRSVVLFDDVGVHADEVEQYFTVQGNLYGLLPQPDERGVTIQRRVEVDQRLLHRQGSYQGTGCLSGEWFYREFLQTERVLCTAMPRLVGEPIRYEWWLSNEDHSQTIELQTGIGSEPVPPARLRANCSYGFAPPVTQDISLQYTLSEDRSSVIFQNRPTDGNFRCWLRVRATDPLGHLVENFVQLDVEGDDIDFGQEYYARLEECARQASREVEQTRALDWAGEFPRLLDEVADSKWSSMFELLPLLLQSHDPDVTSLLQHFQLAYPLPLADAFRVQEYPTVMIKAKAIES